jgi:hypothetical protein
MVNVWVPTFAKRDCRGIGGLDRVVVPRHDPNLRPDSVEGPQNAVKSRAIACVGHISQNHDGIRCEVCGDPQRQFETTSSRLKMVGVMPRLGPGSPWCQVNIRNRHKPSRTFSR